MIATTERVRLAITALGDERLCNAVEALVEAGLTREQICVIARKCELARACHRSQEHSNGAKSLAWLCDSLETWHPTTGKVMQATSGPVLQLLRQLAGEEKAGAGVAVKGPLDLDLDSHLAHGRAVIVVRSAEPKQQLVSARTLLTHSRHRVSTYELTVPQV